MKMNNKGFSLIELLVTIAIMAIVAVGSSLSYSAVRRADVSKAGETLNALMSQVRMNNMSKTNAQYMYIYINNNSICYKLSETKVNTASEIRSLSDEEVNVCKDSIELNFEADSASSVTITENNFLAISFEKSTGAFKCFYNISDVNLKKIELSRSSKTSTITVATETGKHTIS